MARILDGRRLGRNMGPALRARIAALPRPPGLAVIRVGDDPASAVYVASKQKRAQRLGFHQESLHLPASTTQADLLAHVARLNDDDRIDGILVQLPLPGHIDATVVLDHIDPEKDVDGFHPENVGLLSQGRPRFVPCTPRGCMALLEDAGVELSGAHAVVVGRSNIVGRPMAMLLEKAHCTVTLCHSRTVDLAGHVGRADVLVAAVGRPEMIPGAWVKPGAVVIDVGINRLDDGRLVGDVEFGAAEARAAAITPVPGGVGPMTITMLMHNTVDSAERRLAGRSA
ncbi:MAG: bifunctional methylenetetrahydrofolate dehydrogenase/methenyltetrahydrofolate cyclohydrolase FolD [Deltaproteobacteria bacterium]|nr:MAG: bifunctional methylenetetrahydrofolate dehydrogenase/methenyltetrahydrofolate cyclohydrolase FolD [Deltaproteobacteria bacterium]